MAERFSDHVRVSEIGGRCVLTLPFTTPDDRRISVIIERRLGAFVVHDAGKTLGSLFSHGINFTPIRNRSHEDIAKLYGVVIRDGLAFEKVCREEEVEGAVWSIAQCAMLAARDIVDHRPSVLEDPLAGRVARLLDKWKPSYVDTIQRNVDLKGKTSAHRFNFLSQPKIGQRYHPVAVRLLATAHPQMQARIYGFAGLDLEAYSLYEHLKRLAVITNVQEWPKKSLNLVNRFSDHTIELRTDEADELPRLLPDAMTHLSSPGITLH